MWGMLLVLTSCMSYGVTQYLEKATVSWGLMEILELNFNSTATKGEGLFDAHDFWKYVMLACVLSID